MSRFANETLLIATDAVGGVWSYSVELARGFAERGHKCVLATLGPEPNGAQRGEIANLTGCDLVGTGLPLEWVLTSRQELDVLISELRRQADALGATRLHLHAPALAANGWHLPTVVTAHSCMATWWDAVRGGPRPDSIAWHAEATAQGLSRADAVLVPTEAFASDVRCSYGITRHLDVVHNGMAPFCTEPLTRQKFVLAAGRLWDESKNIAVLDRAAAKMRTPIRAAGSLRAPGGQEVSFPNLEPLGSLSRGDMASMMASSAIFASCSRYEPFGLAVLEAAQLGTPLVLADIPTFRELWSDAAMFVPPNDPDAWAKALDDLTEDGARRSALGVASEAAARRYTREAMVSATADIHARLASSKRRAA